ncbi:MAG: zinc-finger domain-containing protein [Pseudomonadota bacterium]
MSNTASDKPSAAIAATRHTETIEVTAQQLPLHCPLPDAPLWSRHPRVFLDIMQNGQVVCPYCSAHYVFTGAAPSGHA